MMTASAICQNEHCGDFFEPTESSDGEFCCWDCQDAAEAAGERELCDASASC